MASIKLCFLVLSSVVTCAAGMTSVPGDADNSTILLNITAATVSAAINPTNATQNTTSIPSATNYTSSTLKPTTTTETDVKKMTVPKSLGTSKATTETTTKNKGIIKEEPAKSSSATGIIILIVVIILVAALVIACYWTRRRGQRYSVGPTSRADEVNIPLSAAEPPADPVSHNGLQTFASAAATSKEPQEPEAKAEVQEEQKAEANKSAAESGAESADPAPAPAPAPALAPALDGPEDKPKQAAAEPSPPAPVEPSAGEKNDDGGLGPPVTPAETNKNNSNNADWTARDSKARDEFWDVSLHCPV